MTSVGFCYWLQGFFEIKNANLEAKELSKQQVEMIEKHLNLVFVHEIDPSMGNEYEQDKLNAIHNQLDNSGGSDGAWKPGKKLPGGAIARC